MRMFETDHSWNWVDENNKMVGFDNYQACCELFGYSWLDSELKKTAEISNDDPELQFTGVMFSFGYVIDNEHRDGWRFEAKKGDKIYYLHIWNDHNGYYCHDFFMKDGDKIIIEDCI